MCLQITKFRKSKIIISHQYAHFIIMYGSQNNARKSGYYLYGEEISFLLEKRCFCIFGNKRAGLVSGYKLWHIGFYS